MVKFTALVALALAAGALAMPAQQHATTSSHKSTSSQKSTSTSHKTSSSSHKTTSTSSHKTTSTSTHKSSTSTKTTTSATATGTSIVANFDDITVVVAGTSLQPIGNYDGLTWTSFDVIDIGSGVTGVVAQSSPNVALIYILSTLATSASLAPITTTSTFTLSSFYFGCVLSTEESLASAPTDCKITLSGYRNGVEVVTQVATFDVATGTLLAPMTKVAVTGFTKVDEIIFTQDGTLAAATSVVFDNVAYQIYA